MTKKLEQLFDLDEEVKVPKHKEIQSVDDSYKAIQDISGTLPRIKELDQLGDHELDDLANKAELAYDELMDLGMNVEVRYSSRIFEVASSMLKSAIDAKTNKIEKKLKAVDLQLKKYKIDSDNSSADPADMINGEGFVVTDRNDLMKKLGKKD